MVHQVPISASLFGVGQPHAVRAAADPTCSRVTAVVKCALAWLTATVCLAGSTGRASGQLPPDAVWLRPEAVVAASGPAFGTIGQPDADHDSLYGAGRAIDDNPATFCCLLDDTPAAADVNPQAIPPGGSKPVTGRIVFDLGRADERRGGQAGRAR